MWVDEEDLAEGAVGSGQGVGGALGFWRLAQFCDHVTCVMAVDLH